MKSLLREQVSRDLLDLAGGAPVQRRKRDRGTDLRRDRIQILRIKITEVMLSFFQEIPAVSEDLRSGCIL